MSDRDINSLALELAGAIQKMREQISKLEKDLSNSRSKASKWHKIAHKLHAKEVLTSEEYELLGRSNEKYSSYYPKNQNAHNIWKTK